jgi:ATP-dependent DNA ligase
VRPDVVVEVTYLTWTEDNLLRQVSYQGQREDKPAKQVVRRVPPSSPHVTRIVVRVFELNGNAIAIRQGCCRQLAPPE